MEHFPFGWILKENKHSKSNEDNNQLYILFIINYNFFNYDAKVKFLGLHILIYFLTNN